ncbi:MAG: hypothetical protein R6X02_19625 [Enhygromyxa sp.]
MTTQTTIVEEFDSSTTHDSVLLRFPKDLDRGDLLPPPDPVAGAPLGRDPSRRAELNQYKGGSDQWFVTYELGPDTDDEGSCPQVTRVYLSGELCSWELGTFTTRSGAVVFGVKIEYERTHESYRTHDSSTEYPTLGNARRFAKIIEVPPGATHVELRSSLPDRYRHALHLL